MYIESDNRNSPPAILLRESYRDGGKIKKRTIANLSVGRPNISKACARCSGEGRGGRSGDHRGAPRVPARACGGRARHAARHRSGSFARACRQPLPDLVIAMMVAPLISPASKLATAMLDPLTAAFSLGETPGLGAVDEDELYVALDWLGERRGGREGARSRAPARRLGCSSVSSSMWRGAAASWRSSATTATARRASCRSSTVCCARATVVRWRSRCSKATPPIRARSPRRSTRSRSAARSITWCWSVTVE